ncbi:oligosaccharide flippase family protein [Nodosilinea sp. LEGE 06152]|uniref:oligosaccharide flippase family protein n=1 Tax=Nodosilinea sp. LEGE 06152 TaxID=2777966 RepID=UPI001882914B|nr:oligosaccharide flippase family protein [Nodosilinea sp. LEGE 06152]MBE9157911.1 oligosaccharide flippase family protein [Nodosilinea sp. LEGE 06152]
MKSIQAWFSKDGFNQNVLKLATGTTFVQVVSIGMSPILSRLFTPSDYGVIAIYLGITTSISVIATGQYEVSIVLPEKDEEAVNVVALTASLAVISSLLSLVIISVFNQSIAKQISNIEISRWLYFIPVTVLQTGVYQTLSYWSNRKKYYRKLVETSILQSLLGAAFNLYAGLNDLGVGGLICSGLISQTIGISYLGFHIFRKDHELGKYVSLNKSFVYAAKYKDFPKFNAPQVFLDTFRTNGIYFAISTFYSMESLGHYSLAQRVIQLPISLISTPISQVFYQEIAEAHNHRINLWLKCKELIKKLLVVFLPLLLGIMLLAPVVFSIAFGDKWLKAGIYARILVPWIILSFLASPLSMVPVVLGKQKQFFFIGLAVSILLPGFALVLANFQVEFSILLLGVSSIASLSLLGVILWTRKISSNSQMKILDV